MDAAYWNLVWATGMPEAWLMSRGGLEPAQARDGTCFGEKRGMFGPPAGVRPHSDSSPGCPEGLC